LAMVINGDETVTNADRMKLMLNMSILNLDACKQSQQSLYGIPSNEVHSFVGEGLHIDPSAYQHLYQEPFFVIPWTAAEREHLVAEQMVTLNRLLLDKPALPNVVFGIGAPEMMSDDVHVLPPYRFHDFAFPVPKFAGNEPAVKPEPSKLLQAFMKRI
jgi:hypothetical protein